MGMVIANERSAALVDDNGRYALNVQHAGRCGREVVFHWSVWNRGMLLATGDELGGPDPTPLVALGALVTFLGADAERYAAELDGRPHDDYLFNGYVAAFAHGIADDLALAEDELSLGVHE